MIIYMLKGRGIRNKNNLPIMPSAETDKKLHKCGSICFKKLPISIRIHFAMRWKRVMWVLGTLRGSSNSDVEQKPMKKAGSHQISY